MELDEVVAERADLEIELEQAWRMQLELQYQRASRESELRIARRFTASDVAATDTSLSEGKCRTHLQEILNRHNRVRIRFRTNCRTPDRYYLKAMNCPHHHKLFAAIPRSYRDLPLRLAEYGTDYRYEKSGELFGLMRVRLLHMNDAHLYMTPEQFEDEFNAVNEMYLNYFKLFGIDKYLMRFSTHDPSKLGQKFVDEPELWKQTEEMTRRVLKDSGIDYVEVPNEAAFYGPKIDVQVVERDRSRIHDCDQSGRFCAAAQL